MSICSFPVFAQHLRTLISCIQTAKLYTINMRFVTGIQHEIQADILTCHAVLRKTKASMHNTSPLLLSICIP